jgi:hypothetical protein
MNNKRKRKKKKEDKHHEISLKNVVSLQKSFCYGIHHEFMVNKGTWVNFLYFWINIPAKISAFVLLFLKQPTT